MEDMLLPRPRECTMRRTKQENTSMGKRARKERNGSEAFKRDLLEL